MREINWRAGDVSPLIHSAILNQGTYVPARQIESEQPWPRYPFARQFSGIDVTDRYEQQTKRFIGRHTPMYAA